jgi:hypothetical protein
LNGCLFFFATAPAPFICFHWGIKLDLDRLESFPSAVHWPMGLRQVPAFAMPADVATVAGSPVTLIYRATVHWYEGSAVHAPRIGRHGHAGNHQEHGGVAVW